MKKTFVLLVALLFSGTLFCQAVSSLDSVLRVRKMQKDSTLRVMAHADSVKVEKEFADKLKWDKINALLVYPLLNGGPYSGIIPVKDPTEIPDPGLDYKLLFELTANNPDSASAEINAGLTEVARIINLHIASGIPAKKIFPVIVVHAAALNAITGNEYYKKHYKLENPNLKLIGDLTAAGARFIACGQAMNFFNIKKEELLPLVKVSLTAQTALSSYQLRGYVKYVLQ